MFGKGIRLFTLAGFEVKLDLSWIIIAVLVTWSLAVGWFPHVYEGLEIGTYWYMGVAGALGLFISIILHEFGHSVVARAYGIPIRGITLFIFGGVAEMEKEPPTAKSEFLMAIAGPIVSVILVFVFAALHSLGLTLGWPVPVNGVLSYLAWINGIVVIFNLIPAFPLDGGRVLRSILWAWKKRIRWATRIASAIGGGFGFVLIAFGVLNFLAGNFLGGFWLFLIGLFLRGASQMSYQQLLLRKGLEGEPVRRFMNPHPVVVPPSASLKQFVEDYIYATHHKMYPVMDNSRLLGSVSVREVKDIPVEQREMKSVAEVVQPASSDNTIAADADAVEALSQMNRTGSSRLLVMEGDHLAGILSLKDLQKFLSLKIELEEA